MEWLSAHAVTFNHFTFCLTHTHHASCSFLMITIIFSFSLRVNSIKGTRSTFLLMYIRITCRLCCRPLNVHQFITKSKRTKERTNAKSNEIMQEPLPPPTAYTYLFHYPINHSCDVMRRLLVYFEWSVRWQRDDEGILFVSKTKISFMYYSLQKYSDSMNF